MLKTRKLGILAMSGVLAAGLLLSPLSHPEASEDINKLNSTTEVLEGKSKSINTQNEASNLSSEVNQFSDTLNEEKANNENQTEALNKEIQSLTGEVKSKEDTLLHREKFDKAKKLLEKYDAAEKTMSEKISPLNKKERLIYAIGNYDKVLWLEKKGKKDAANEQLKEVYKLYPDFSKENLDVARKAEKALLDKARQAGEDEKERIKEDLENLSKTYSSFILESDYENILGEKEKLEKEREDKRNAFADELKNDETSKYVDFVLTSAALERAKKLKEKVAGMDKEFDNEKTEGYKTLKEQIEAAEQKIKELMPNYEEVLSIKSIEAYKQSIDEKKSSLQEKETSKKNLEESKKSIEALIKRVEEIKITVKNEADRITALNNALSFIYYDIPEPSEASENASPEEVTVAEDATPLGSAPEEAAPSKASEEVVNPDAGAEVEEIVIEDEETAKGKAVLPTDVDIDLNKKKSNVKDANLSNKSVNKNVLAKTETNVLAKTGGLSVNLFTMLTQFSLLIGALFLAIKASKK